MSKFPLFLLLCAAGAYGQTARTSFDKAPADVEDALRSRVQEFYQDHVDGKFRKAEQLVAEESKDGFYAANKPALEAFKIGDISFSDSYKKAKVTIVGKMTMTFLGMGAPKLMDVPFPSYWKIEGGRWCWYIYNDPNRVTPFGKINPQTTSASGDPGAAFKMPDINSIANAIQADRQTLKMAKAAGAEEKVTISNRMPGAVKLQVEQASYPGLEVRLDKSDLREGEKAVVTVRTIAAKEYLTRTVRILVQPLNQAIDILVSF
ncbi:MAG: hypothetical protein JWO80_2782 [Bryobacterales bacterium]|nr:hypothetical protein [Bryobacterales bacterium]